MASLELNEIQMVIPTTPENKIQVVIPTTPESKMQVVIPTTPESKMQVVIHTTPESKIIPCSSKIETPVSCRTLRKRIQVAKAAGTPKPAKRRCNLLPTKLEDLSENQIAGYYLNQKFQLPAIKKLETIFEEPKTEKNGGMLYSGSAKQRRLVFNSGTKQKIKRRKMKLKKIFGSKVSKVQKKPRMTMEAFLMRLHAIMPSTSDNSESVIASFVKCSIN